MSIVGPVKVRELSGDMYTRIIASTGMEGSARKLPDFEVVILINEGMGPDEQRESISHIVWDFERQQLQLVL